MAWRLLEITGIFENKFILISVMVGKKGLSSSNQDMAENIYFSMNLVNIKHLIKCQVFHVAIESDRVKTHIFVNVIPVDNILGILYQPNLIFSISIETIDAYINKEKCI